MMFDFEGIVNIVMMYLLAWTMTGIVLATFFVTYKVIQAIREHGL